MDLLLFTGIVAWSGSLECFAIKFCRSKCKVLLITTASWKYFSEPMRTQRKKNNNQSALKPRKMWATKSWLILVLHLIGWESGASFLDQSQSKVKQNKGKENLCDNQQHFKLMIIYFTFMIFIFDSRVILQREIRSHSLLGLKAFDIWCTVLFCSSIVHLCGYIQEGLRRLQESLQSEKASNCKAVGDWVKRSIVNYL